MSRTKVKEPVFVWLADVESKPVAWLWEPYIPKGCLTFVDGDPGVGKSWFALALAAAVTSGQALPNASFTTPANVVLLSVEDDLAHTIRPRLEGLKADVSKIQALLKGSILFDDIGFQEIDKRLGASRPALLIIDPLVAFLGENVNMNRATDVRSIMEPLAGLAERHDCAIVVVRHINKNQKSKAIYRGAGSIDFIAAGRSVLLVGRDPDQLSQGGVVQIKNNLTEAGPAVGYQISQGIFSWSFPSALTADKILAGSSTQEELSRLEDAVDFLKDFLATGPKSWRDVLDAAKIHQVAEITIRRAGSKLGVKKRSVPTPGKRGGGPSYWFLSEHESEMGEQWIKDKKLINQTTSDEDDFNIQELTKDYLLDQHEQVNP